jgi:hypothetical protein
MENESEEIRKLKDFYENLEIFEKKIDRLSESLKEFEGEVKMKQQDKAIETLKIKGALKPLIDSYGYYRIQEVLMGME